LREKPQAEASGPLSAAAVFGRAIGEQVRVKR